ncbi:class I SAM-dependent methyltransferase [Microbispora sp. KK1-11]|uniref:class I SAM-dependent methyltransferase n=1 Tax=Microbispora sp. KK1-11 TaxID=2053005 RepID=UPI001157E5E9|nr:class I SAM-dependent methyltransferase [Microbispora sp. KK1-11]TQS31218.1 class I SAM-dependent methyltransferase [Microbispora sp. KK1-11]
MAQYDKLADLYAAMSERLRPYRTHVERHNFWKITGTVEGLTALDMACGDGVYSRALAERGAKVIGIDQSAEMIRIAKGIEDEQNLGIRYQVQDAAELESIGQFDLVTAIYLLQYAPTREALESMCRALRANLKEGGRLVTLVFNPHMDPARADMAKYGMTVKLPENKRDGAPIWVEVLLDPPAGFTVYHWSQEAYEQALEDAGFTNLTWHEYEVSPEGLAERPPGYWDDYITNPHVVYVTCDT